MRRTMQVLQGLGPQESNATYDFPYDHPYFGQIFLAAALSLVNYPDSLNPSVNLHSIEMLYLVPRVIMGILAIVDTFLVYKIAETRYNRKVGFISATIFAVTPLSHLLRAILLDSIELPFILLSILFAIYYAKSESRYSDTGRNDKNIILLLLSGIFLGLAMFTKAPVFTMIPLIAFILIKKDCVKTGSRNTSINPLKVIGMWIVPVVLIPLIWPAYAISIGQFSEWLDGVVYQAERGSVQGLRHSISVVSQSDPVLLVLGAAGIIYAIVKRDYFILLWAFPYLIFLYAIGWVVYFHWISLIPLLCIGISIIIEKLTSRGYRKYRCLPAYGIISLVGIFGLFGIVMVMVSNLNASYNDVYLLVARQLSHHQDANPEDGNEAVTLIGSHRTRALIWIPLYVFNDDAIFRDTDLPHDNFTKPIQTQKFILVADSNLLERLTNAHKDERDSRITRLYYERSSTIATFIDKQSNIHEFMSISENNGFGPFVEVRVNYNKNDPF